MRETNERREATDHPVPLSESQRDHYRALARRCDDQAVELQRHIDAAIDRLIEAHETRLGDTVCDDRDAVIEAAVLRDIDPETDHAVLQLAKLEHLAEMCRAVADR